MLASVEARWSPPVDWSFLMSSSLMSMSSERSVELPQRQTVGVERMEEGKAGEGKAGEMRAIPKESA